MDFNVYALDGTTGALLWLFATGQGKDGSGVWVVCVPRLAHIDSIRPTAAQGGVL